VIFRDRTDAGRQLAARLAKYAHRSDILVLALPRGGVPVAHEVAKQLGAPLDFDQTRAVEPLESTPEWTMEEVGEPAETFPSGL